MKLLWIAATVILATIVHDPIALAGLWTMQFFFAASLAGLGFWRFTRVILPFSPLVIGYLVVNVLFNHSGNSLGEFGPLTVTAGGLSLGIALCFRVLTILTTAFLFSMTIDPRDLVLSLIQIARLSYRVGFGVYVGLRFMPLVKDEFDAMRAARLVRGLQAGKSASDRVRDYISYAIPLLATLIRKAINTAYAMESKGFGAMDTRTYLHTVRIRAFDVAMFALLTTANVGVVVLLSVRK